MEPGRADLAAENARKCRVKFPRIHVAVYIHFFAQVIDVVFGHQDLDPVDEFLMGAGVARENLAFLYEVDFEVELIEGDEVSEVAE